jgi:hypothetical protein
VRAEEAGGREAPLASQVDRAGQRGTGAFGAVHQLGIEAVEHDLAAPEQPQLTVRLAVQPVDVDVAVAALAVDLRPAVVEPTVLLYTRTSMRQVASSVSLGTSPTGSVYRPGPTLTSSSGPCSGAGLQRRPGGFTPLISTITPLPAYLPGARPTWHLCGGPRRPEAGQSWRLAERRGRARRRAWWRSRRLKVAADIQAYWRPSGGVHRPSDLTAI